MQSYIHRDVSLNLCLAQGYLSIPNTHVIHMHVHIGCIYTHPLSPCLFTSARSSTRLATAAVSPSWTVACIRLPWLTVFVQPVVCISWHISFHWYKWCIIRCGTMWEGIVNTIFHSTSDGGWRQCAMPREFGALCCSFSLTHIYSWERVKIERHGEPHADW